MPRTVNEGFLDFHTSLTPSSAESDAAKSHRASIEACLKANFSLVRLFRTGSFGNGTSVSGYSDVDYFASIPRANLTQNSTSFLNSVRTVLNTRFNSTNISVNCPAVFAPFGTNAKDGTEIVPADCIEKTSKGHLVYEIADCSGGWMRSSPDAHNAYVNEINQKFNSKLKPLIRFIKAWKFYRCVPISSFYLELRVTKYAEGESSIIYSMDVRRILKHLSDIDLAKMQDPCGISGYISPCSTDVKLQDAKSKLSTALSRAINARDAEEAGNIENAFYWWRLLYDDHFPTYYK